MACTFEIIKYNMILRNRKFANIHFCTRKFDLTSLILKDTFHDRRNDIVEWKLSTSYQCPIIIETHVRTNLSCVMEKKNNSKIPFSNNYFYFWPVPYSYFRDTSEKSKVYKVECRERERERKSVFYLNGSTILSINKKNRVRF